MHDILLIHYDNTPLLERFPINLKFNPSTDELNNSDIDTFISKQIIPQLQEISFDILCIKDTLSENYIDFYGLILAYHIRLNRDLLKEKSMVPIIILSDINELMINKLSSFGRLLFTKNIFLCKNNVGSVEHLLSVDLMPLSEDDYENAFIKSIHINQPQDYLTHHSIANEWSIYRWAEYLDVNTSDINKIRDDISSMLYFKYLQAKFPIKRSLFSKYKQEIQGKGKILYIDDEWEKGWKSIFEHLSLENKDYSLETVEEVYKDKSQEEIITFIMEKVMSVDPDVIILDMRLHEDDFLEGKGLADFTGIQIFNQIKEINPGIQVIVFTASSNSLLLDELYSYDSSILGYVKKEHPKNYNLTTQGNINKLISFINQGLEKKYLKDVFSTQNNLLELNLFKELKFSFDMSDNDRKLFELKNTVSIIFNTLDSNISKPFIYGMLTIFKCIEIINDYFIYENWNNIERKNEALWKNNNTKIPKNGNVSVNNKITSIIELLNLQHTENIKLYINQLSCSRNHEVHGGDIRSNCQEYVIKNPNEINILNWFEILATIIKNIK